MDESCIRKVFKYEEDVFQNNQTLPSIGITFLRISEFSTLAVFTQRGQRAIFKELCSRESYIQWEVEQSDVLSSFQLMYLMNIYKKILISEITPQPPKSMILVSDLSFIQHSLVSRYYMFNTVLLCRDTMVNRQQSSCPPGIYNAMMEKDKSTVKSGRCSGG